MIPPPNEVYARLLREILPERIQSVEYRTHLEGYLVELLSYRLELSDAELKLMGLLQVLVEDYDRRSLASKSSV